MQQIKTMADWEALKEKSETEKVIVFKYSNACPVSFAAMDELQVADFEDSIYMVTVQTEREISNKIAEDVGVQHQSPQVLLIEKGKSVFDVSHFKVKNDVIAANL